MEHHHVIRKMTIADVPSVYAIEQKVDPTPWSGKLFHDCINVGYDCWVLTENLQIVGFAILSYSTAEAHILKISIQTEFQRQGLGKKLLQHLLTMAKIHEVDEIFLEVRQSNLPAINLYKKYNFVEVGMRKGYYPADDHGNPKEDALTMALAL